MLVHLAKTALLDDRMDWNRPHLRYLPKKLYRSFFFANRHNR